eukprot:COSAG01_NODE_498_length_16259_cov_11.917512_30_plen_49_part_01
MSTAGARPRTDGRPLTPPGGAGGGGGGGAPPFNDTATTAIYTIYTIAYT